jgi:hypothetical protein
VNAANPNAEYIFTADMAGETNLVTVTVTNPPTGHGMSGTGNVVAIDDPTESNHPWPSNGPFAVNVLDANRFTFHPPSGVDGTAYTASGVTFVHLLTIPQGTSSITLLAPTALAFQGSAQSTTGVVQLPYVEALARQLLAASTIGGAQPGYQFYIAIYNPITGHVGNRSPIGVRVVPTGNTSISLSGLPNFLGTPGIVQDPKIQWGRNGDLSIKLPSLDPEWRILVGRTGDGGEVPYACIDADGNWITTLTPDQTSLAVTGGEIDGNSELPYNNYPPPAFETFWREGERMCGTLTDQPFVYRSAAEVDSTTGIFVGNPAQAWDPSRVETFPSGEAVISGYSNMQESWCFTADEVGQLSELSGEVLWNGPYGFGLAGPFAISGGWNSLLYWISHDRQLCTMLPGADGPIAISTEYERGLLSRIGGEFDAQGNPLHFMDKTEIVYFRDPTRLVDVLRIKCVDNNGKPFVVIHDFLLRDDSSPYGQGYEEDFLGPLGTNFMSTVIRDFSGHANMWAAAADGAIYQLYTGGLDNTDYYDPTQAGPGGGGAYTADAISLRYIGGERSAVRTLEWYGDEFIRWFIFENMLNVVYDTNLWVDLTYLMRPVPGDAQNARYMADVNRPEMTHCYLWAQLTAHPQDTTNPATPMAFNDPPHMPLETYGRLFLAAPWMANARGR